MRPTDVPADAARAALARGRAAHPELPLDEPAFAGHLARILGRDATAADMAALAIEDLYLACACATGVAGAAAAFTARYGAVIGSAIARIVRDADGKEIEQRLCNDLLVGSIAAPPKIASYGGRSPLDRWLGIVAQRAALVWLRENRAEARARDAAAAEPAGGTHPEMAFLRERYRGDFEQALREALERVGERERVLLRLHLVNGLTVEAIGKMYGVSQPTASRWLAAARETLLEDVEATLAARLGATPAEIASLAGMVASRLDLSLSALLRTR